METIFKVGMKVYDQVNFPNLEGKIEEIYISEGQEYPIVLFEGKKERVCYNFEGCLSDRTTKTLSTKPYKIEFQGFEQKAPARTYEEALKEAHRKGDYYYQPYHLEVPSKELAEATMALLKLLFLRDYYNEGWQPDWKDDTWKYIILAKVGIYWEFIVDNKASYYRVLHFKSREIAEKFLEDQRELLEIAKPLL